MNKVLKLTFSIFLFSAILYVGGCAGTTVVPGETAMERDVRLSRAQTRTIEQLVDDFDTFLLTDEPSKMTRWYVR